MILFYSIFSGNETLTGPDGFGVGTFLLLNTGRMSHGSVGGATTGLSKAISMGLVLIICPSKENETLNFKYAWFACDVARMQPLHLNLLQLLDIAVTQNFWVRFIRVWVGLGLGINI